jgi:hypothetical protein
MPAHPNAADHQPVAPERSLTQRLDALERANNVRARRAKLKSDLKSGRCMIYTVLLDPPQYVQSATALDLLLAAPTYGRVRAHKILAQCRISPIKAVGTLTERQRTELAQLVHTQI